MRSKADMSELNLPHENRQLKSGKLKNRYAKVSADSLGIHVVSPDEEREATVGRICRKGRL